MNLKHHFYRGYYHHFDPRQNAFPDAERKLVQDRNLGRPPRNPGRQSGNTHRFGDANAVLHNFVPRTTNSRRQLDPALYHPGHTTLDAFTNVEPIDLQTTYPGLTLGTGYNHETSTKNEITLGLYFDHTTGLPVLPGSSVKGVLRSAFPRRYRNRYDKAAAATATELIRRCLSHVNAPGDWTDGQIDHFENTTFAGQRDVFLDGVVHAANPAGNIVGPDFLTPHGDNPLRNPTPLRMLKVLPQVSFRFRFRLDDYDHEGCQVTKDQKRELFRVLLLMFGIGAKTNVGYGRLIAPENPGISLPYLDPEKDIVFLTPIKSQKVHYKYLKTNVPYDAQDGFEIEARVLKQEDGFYTVRAYFEPDVSKSFRFEWKHLLVVGAVITLKITTDPSTRSVTKLISAAHKYSTT